MINLGLPAAGTRYGTAGMFGTLGGLAIFFTLAASNFLPERSSDFLNRPHFETEYLTKNGWRVLLAISLFSFGSLAI